MKKTTVMLAILFSPHGSVFAQWFCEKTPAVVGGSVESSNGTMDAIIIGIAILIVLFTLVMSIKYLFMPGEKNPDHIKNIVKDEGF
jgi:ABC-type Co2+ transport system permease subunit